LGVISNAQAKKRAKGKPIRPKKIPQYLSN
jgi:hypothetical protein